MWMLRLQTLPFAEYYPESSYRQISQQPVSIYSHCVYGWRSEKHGPAHERRKKEQQWNMHKKAIGLDTSALVKSRMENIKSLQRDKWEKVFETRGEKPKKTGSREKKKKKIDMEISNGTWEKVLDFLANRHKCIPFFRQICIEPNNNNNKYWQENKNNVRWEQQDHDETNTSTREYLQQWTRWRKERKWNIAQFNWRCSESVYILFTSSPSPYTFTICLKRFILYRYWWASPMKACDEQKKTRRTSVIHCQRNLVVWIGAFLPRDTHF